MSPFSLNPPYSPGMTGERKAQSAVWGLLAMLVLVTLGSGLVDLYRLHAVRNWAYGVAQEAALSAASQGRDWNAILHYGVIRLDKEIAKVEAERLVSAAMQLGGISGYTVLVRILPNAGGGSTPGFPPRPVRLGEALGNWTSDEPAVGVYLEVPVDWTLLGMFGIAEQSVRVFAAAGVSQ